MSTPAVNSGSGSTGATTTTASRVPMKTLGQDDFLKLLVAQLSAQDPLNPQKDTEFIAQMAQFSSLEQARAMEADMSGLRSDQQLLQPSNMIGRTVSLQDSSGAIINGVVSGLNLQTGTPQIMVNGNPYAMNQLISVTTPSTNK